MRLASTATRLVFALLVMALAAAMPAPSFGQEAAPGSSLPASPTPTPLAFHWQRIDVTVELQEDSSFHVTSREQVAFAGGPFQSGFAEIPLARIESVDTIRVGEVRGDTVEPYRYVEPGLFTADAPRTYTYSTLGRDVVIDWAFPPTFSLSRTFQLEYVAHGALRVYDEAQPPYQQIVWIGVGEELTLVAPIAEATLTFILPCPVDPSQTAGEGFGATDAAGSMADGQTWVWTARDLDAGDSLQASLRFPPLVQAEQPSWQGRADRQEQQATGEVSPAPAAISSPVAPAPIGAACLDG